MDDAHGKLSRYLEIDIGIWKRATNTRVDRSTAVSLSLSAPPATLKWKRVRCCEERVISSNRLAPCVDPRSLARSLADFQSLVSRSSPRQSRDSIDEFGFHDPSLLVSVDSEEKSGKTRNFHSAVLPPPSSTPLFFVLPSWRRTLARRHNLTTITSRTKDRLDRHHRLTAREETKRWENAVSTRRVAADISACRPKVSAISRARE